MRQQSEGEKEMASSCWLLLTFSSCQCHQAMLLFHWGSGSSCRSSWTHIIISPTLPEPLYSPEETPAPPGGSLLLFPWLPPPSQSHQQQLTLLRGQGVTSLVPLVELLNVNNFSVSLGMVGVLHLAPTLLPQCSLFALSVPWLTVFYALLIIL